MKARILIILTFALALTAALGQTDSTLYVRQFPGLTVADKLTAAMAACNPNTSVPCILVLDPSLASYRQGTLPSLCAQCSLQDLRSGVTGASLSATVLQKFAGPIAASTNATINVQDGKYKLACDGTTDDMTAFQAAVTAGEASGALLIFPANATCLISSSITITGVVRWQGTNTTILISPSAPLQYAFGATGNITALDIGGFTFQGNSNLVAGFVLSAGTMQNISFHNNTFTGITGCPASPNTWSNTEIELRGATNVKIKDNQFLANGCASYWYTSGPTGSAVFNYSSTPSYNWEISGNTINNTYAIMGLLLFNLYDSTIHDNTIQNVALGGSGGNNDSNSSGYGIVIYAVSICGGATAASPTGLSRTSNVVTVNFSGTCSPALAAGDTFNIYGSTSVGGTGFDGAYTVVTGGTTSVTATLDTGTSLANDTGGGGAVQWSPRRDRVHDNDVQNAAGMGIYLQGVVDSTAHDNVFSNVCTSFDDTSLPCGFVSLNGTQRVSVSGNDGTRSTKDGIISASSVGITAYGNNVGGARYGLRLRGAEKSETWFGNTINGGTKSTEIDGAALSNVILGNTTRDASLAHIATTSGANFNVFAGNNMQGDSLTSVTGVQAVGGSSNLFLMNAAQGFRGSAFDIRGPYNLVGFNYAYGGSGIGISSGSASYSLFTKNYFINQGTGFNDTSGQSNVISDNYFSNVAAQITNLSGMAMGNQLKGGVSGVYPVGSCTLVSGACTITTAEVQSTDNGKIWCTRGSTGANPGFPYVSAITAGTSFVVTSTSATDTGNVSCRIQH